MTPEKYQILTGNIISEREMPRYEALIRRASALLWDKLGWNSVTEDYVSILGQTKTDCPCSIDQSDLDPAPQLRGQARVFPLNLKEPNVFTDPYTKVHAVYLCRVEPEGRRIVSDNNSVVIMRKVENWSPAYFSSDFGKYIKKCQGCCSCASGCTNGCKNCVNVLVDADWINADNLPDDLLYLLCDYVDFLVAGGNTNALLNIRSESVTGHSVSYGGGTKNGSFNPFNDPSNLNLLLKYSGPFGSVKRLYLR